MQTPFNWKVLEESTLRAYTRAAKDYESFAGRPVAQADRTSITAWQKDMESRGLSVSTIRQRLSAVSTISGVKVKLPKRQCTKDSTLNLEQVRAFFGAIKSRSDRALMASILFIGCQPRKSVTGHLIGSGLDVLEGSPNAQAITRKVKKYAKRAGLNEAEMNLRTLSRSGKALVQEHSVSELVKATAPNPSEDQNRIACRPLCGIGRRSRSIKA